MCRRWRSELCACRRAVARVSRTDATKTEHRRNAMSCTATTLDRAPCSPASTMCLPGDGDCKSRLPQPEQGERRRHCPRFGQLVARGGEGEKEGKGRSWLPRGLCNTVNKFKPRLTRGAAANATVQRRVVRAEERRQPAKVVNTGRVREFKLLRCVLTACDPVPPPFSHSHPLLPAALDHSSHKLGCFAFEVCRIGYMSFQWIFRAFWGCVRPTGMLVYIDSCSRCCLRTTEAREGTPVCYLSLH